MTRLVNHTRDKIAEAAYRRFTTAKKGGCVKVYEISTRFGGKLQEFLHEADKLNEMFGLPVR